MSLRRQKLVEGVTRECGALETADDDGVCTILGRKEGTTRSGGEEDIMMEQRRLSTR